MGIFKRKKKIVDEVSAVGTTGYRIKKFRVMRDMSQKELGLKCGFPEASAVVRVSQYETNKQLPRDKQFFKVISNALNLNDNAIFDLDLSEPDLIYHLLFELEDVYQVSPYIVNGVCCLRFGSLPYDYSNVSKLDSFIREWAEAKEEYAIHDGDSEEEKKYKRHRYEIWKGEYPPLVIHTISEENRMKLERVRLQANMDEITASLNESKEALETIKDKANTLKTDEGKENRLIQKKSDLLRFFMEILEKGLPIRGMFVKGIRNSVRPYKKEYSDLMSVKLEDIKKSDENIKLYADILSVMENLRNMGLSIEERVTAYQNELYVTYSYPWSEDKLLYIPEEVWEDMIRKVDFVNDNEYGNDYIYRQQKEAFLEDFCNNFEVLYSQPPV